MEYLLTFRHYLLEGLLLEPTDFWKLLGTIEKDLEDDARAQEEEEEEEEEPLARRPRSRHTDIKANTKAAALLKKATRLPPETYDVQRVSDALDCSARR
jgi:hypothetical protein